MQRAFTLIELLIVVAIIAILAAIAVPHLMEAQTRSKVSYVHASMAALATAQEMYFVDRNRYPPNLTLIHVTTPIAYITSVPEDRFKTRDMRQELQQGNPGRYYFEYVAAAEEPFNFSADYYSYNRPYFPDRRGGMYPTPARWLYKSWGPTGIDHLTIRYDPTNGTVSDGDIARFGPG